MPAMVGPVGIQHADLRNRRVTPLLFGVIIPDKAKITVGHGKAQGII